MRIFVYTMCLLLALVTMPGCGGDEKPKTETAKKDNTTNTTKTATKKNPLESRPKQQYDAKGRPLPSVGSMGGGGSMTAASTGGTTTNNNNSNSNNESNSGSSSFSPDGGLANGLFPQAGGTTYTSVFNDTGVGGGLYPQRGTGASSSTTSSISSPLVSQFGSSSNTTPSVSPAEAKVPKKVSEYGEFYDTAFAAFESGDGEKGLDHLYAYVLANNDALDKYPMQWHASVKKPRIALRWGVGITLGGSLDGRAPVIGEAVADDEEGGGRSNPEELSFASGGSSNTRGGNDDAPPTIYEMVDTTTPIGVLLYYTGDVGEQLVTQLDKRRKKGSYFGKVLKSMPEVLPEEKPEEEEVKAETKPDNGRTGNFINRSRKKFPIPSIGSMGGGGGATPATNAGGGGNNNGGGGNTAAPSADSRRAARSLVTRWGAGEASDTPDDDIIGELTPGVVGLGVGDRDELADRARENDVDCLLIISVNGQKRKESTYSSTKIRLVDLNKPTRTLADTSNMNNADVMKARQSGRKDPVASQISRFFEDDFVSSLRADDMPTLNESQAYKRIQGLADAAESPLRDSVEVLWYFRQNLITESEAIEAIDKLIDGKGDVIVTGSEDERREALASYLN